MSPEIRPKSFGTFEKQAPGIHYILFPFSVVAIASSFSSLNKPRGFKYLLYLPSEAGLGYFDSDCCQCAEIETLFNTSQIEPNQEIKLGRRGEGKTESPAENVSEQNRQYKLNQYMVAKPRIEPGWATLVEEEYSLLRQPCGVKPSLLVRSRPSFFTRI